MARDWMVGSKNSKAKLSEAVVIEIRGRLAKGEIPAELARQYPASISTLKRIKAGKLWAHLGGRVVVDEASAARLKAAVIVRQIAGIRRRAIARSTCSDGHALEGDNLGLAGDGRRGRSYRYCRRCRSLKRKAMRDGSHEYRVSRAIARAIWGALKRGSNGKLFSRLPYTVGELMQHLERLFLPGMTWENYGQWHVDHVIPRVRFNQVDPLQFAECWALSNLQPLWEIDNLRKGAKHP